MRYVFCGLLVLSYAIFSCVFFQDEVSKTEIAMKQLNETIGVQEEIKKERYVITDKLIIGGVIVSLVCIAILIKDLKIRKRM